MSLGAIIGYLLQAPVWIRLTIFLVTIPITILLNSIRIGLTGLLVENWGLAHTQGFLHFFEGWVVFIAATLVLLAVIWLLLRVFMPGVNIRDALWFDVSETASVQAKPAPTRVMAASKVGFLWVLAIFMFVAASFSTGLILRKEAIPERSSLSSFPASLGVWAAKEYRLPVETENVAGASEYYIGDFTSPDDGAVNFYVSFYKTQLNGQIPHSPKVCIPGGGWSIDKSEKVRLKNQHGETFEANRLVISKGEMRQLAYYWLKQGSRMYSQESLARIDLVRSSIFENRTDGALVRVVTDIDAQHDESAADARLQKFVQGLVEVLPQYVPD
jgi:exosortase D (VPLPA-CTERM-specific)